MKASKHTSASERRLKSRNPRPEYSGARLGTSARQTNPKGRAPAAKIHPLLAARGKLDHAQPLPASLPAPGAARSESATASASPHPTHFELVATDACSVFLAGSFNQWNPSATAMVRSGNGKWVADLSLPPGRYEYLYLVNGNYWTSDPEARDYASNPFGGYNSVLVVPASS
ncbi:MAG: isoamylase early set domain-containing protein [Verrucomicrobia bacterium]|nr:isoamylase early set domain-containing protein [Verrucomicrobiota bacterium]